MSGNELSPGAQTEPRSDKRRQRDDYYLEEMETILNRMADLLRIVVEEITVFEYFNEKYRLHDTDLDEF